MPLQLFVRSHFHAASLSVEVQPDASVSDVSAQLLVSLQALFPPFDSSSLHLHSLLTPATMAFMHATRHIAGRDTRRCAELGWQHGTTLQLMVAGTRAAGGLCGGSTTEALKLKRKTPAPAHRAQIHAAPVMESSPQAKKPRAANQHGAASSAPSALPTPIPSMVCSSAAAASSSVPPPVSAPSAGSLSIVQSALTVPAF